MKTRSFSTNFKVVARQVLLLLFFFIAGNSARAQCPDFNDCFSLLAFDGCTYTFVIEVDGDAVWNDQSNPFDAHLVQWNFRVLGDGEVVSSGFLDNQGDLATNTNISITNTANTVTVSHFDLNNPIETWRLTGGHFIFTVEGEAGSCFTVERSGTNGVFNFGGVGVCNVTGTCDAEEYCPEGNEVSGNVHAPGDIYDCPDTENHGIEGAEISITTPSGESCQTTTSNDGSYSCLFCDNGPYEICVETTCEDPCGVTDFDLVRLREYILGIRKWSKDIYIIGDVNQDGNTNTLDLVLIQRDILGLNTTQIENWCKFVPVEDYEQGPQIGTVDDDQYYEAVDNCITVDDPSVSTDFVRYMLGDLDGSCTDCIHGDEMGELPIVIDQDGNNTPKTFVKSSTNDKIHALTLHLSIPEGVNALGISSPLPEFEYTMTDDEIHFIWIDRTENNEGYMTTQGEVLLEVLTDEPCIVHTVTDENYWLSGDSGMSRIRSENRVSPRNYSSMKDQQIWIGSSTTINIDQIVGNGQLSLFDTYGRLVHQQNVNQTTESIDVMPNIGVYIIHIKDQNGMKSYKIFLQ